MSVNDGAAGCGYARRCYGVQMQMRTTVSMVSTGDGYDCMAIMGAGADDDG